MDFRICFKILVVTCGALNGQALVHLCSIFLKHKVSCTFQSQVHNLLVVPRRGLKTGGDIAFQSTALRLNLPLELRLADSKNLSCLLRLLFRFLFICCLF